MGWSLVLLSLVRSTEQIIDVIQFGYIRCAPTGRNVHETEMYMCGAQATATAAAAVGPHAKRPSGVAARQRTSARCARAARARDGELE